MKTNRIQSVGTTLLILLFLCTNLLWAENQEAVRKKEYNQSFAVSPNNKLLVDSKYGNITIAHWKKDEVAFRVVVEAKARNEKQVQDVLERIQITLKKEGNTIMGFTDIRSSFDNFSGNFSINYYISMPSWLNMTLEQKYGNIQLPKTDNKGVCNIALKYGKIEAGNFTQVLNLEAKYSNVTLGSLKENGNLDLAYCDNVRIDDSQVLNINSKYSNLELGKIHVVNLDKKYGQLYAKDIYSLNVGSIKYSTVKVDRLGWNLDCLYLGYSNIDVMSVYPTDKELNIEVKSHYGNLYVGMPEKASFKVEATDIEYGDCDVSRQFNATHREKHDDSCYYEINNGHNGSIKFNGDGYGKLSIGVSE